VTFDDAFTAYWLLTVNVAHHILGNMGDAEDTAAEAWARTWVRRDQVADLRNYVLTATRHQAIDRYRWQTRRPSLSLDVPGFEVPNPRCPVERQDRLLDTRTALDGLSPNHRRVVTAFGAGYSTREIAETLSTTNGTVKTWLDRARTRAGLIESGAPLPYIGGLRKPLSDAATEKRRAAERAKKARWLKKRRAS